MTMIRRKRKSTNSLTEVLRIANEYNMTYGQLQVLETKGEVIIANGELYSINEEGKYEPYRRNTQREL